jgi:hypothetical protein
MDTAATVYAASRTESRMVKLPALAKAWDRFRPSAMDPSPRLHCQPEWEGVPPRAAPMKKTSSLPTLGPLPPLCRQSDLGQLRDALLLDARARCGFSLLFAGRPGGESLLRLEGIPRGPRSRSKGIG